MKTDTAPLGRTATGARDGIAELIASGVFGPGQKLPGERELAERLGVSRVVLRDALASLEGDGRIERSAWRGWFVTAPRMAEHVELRSFTEIAVARGLCPGARVMRKDVRPASEEEAGILGLAPSAPVLELHRLRTLDGSPACYDVSVISLAAAPGLELADFVDTSLYEVLLAVAEVHVVRTDYTMRAESVAPELAALLGIPAGAPVLVGEEVASDLAGRPILLGRISYRADAYEFQATLFRPYAEGGA